MSDTLEQTPLHEEHLRLGGKMVPFAGYAMPVQYPSGIQAEHRAVREAAGLFDVSHMGEFHLAGPQALALIQEVTVNDAGGLAVGQAQYSALCQEDGGVIDDLLVYRTGDQEYLMVVNAANRAADWAQVKAHAGDKELDLEDRSDAYGLLALQGPRAAEVLARVSEVDLDGLGYYRCTSGTVAGVPGLVARTGYTGEDGFELYLPAGESATVWRSLLEVGKDVGILPAGLGARDSLRLEMGYPLYGNDLDRDHTALEGGLGWVVKLDKGPFVGQEALARQKEAGVERRLAGIRLTGRGFPRPGYPVVVGGEEVGTVTSGTMSPSLGEGIALAYLPAALARPETEVWIRVRDRDIPGRVQRPPFYTEGSIRR
jgi:aminomethyltransferase